MALAWVERRSAVKQAAQALYLRVIEQARAPSLYEAFGIPDTPDGRFDMIALHAILVFRRLRQEREQTRQLAQELFDLMFADMDQNLREMGVGDMSIGKRIKGMAQGFYGRLASYDAALHDNDARTLEAALRRNVYRHATPNDQQVKAMTTYVRLQAQALEGYPIASLAAGQVVFGDCSPLGAG